MQRWVQEVNTQVPVILDKELATRIHEITGDWTRFAAYLERQAWGNDWYVRSHANGSWIPADGRVVRLKEYKRILEQRYAWFSANLAAHRRTEPLPTRASLPALPDPPLNPPPSASRVVDPG